MRVSALVKGLSICLLLGIGVLARAEEPKQVKDFDWKKGGPFDYITYLIRLEKNGIKSIRMGDAPKGWLKKEHMNLLVQLLDSKEPCASVSSMRSSIINFNAKPKSSTVGHEAAYLIAGYRHGLYPKYATKTSSSIALNRNEIKRWWARETNGGKPVRYLKGMAAITPEMKRKMEAEAKKWGKAMALWRPFATEYMMRSIEDQLDLRREWLEKTKSGERKLWFGSYTYNPSWELYRHPLLDKYLPDFRMYKDHSSSLRFALSTKGEITCFAHRAPFGGNYKSAPDLKLVSSTSDFLLARGIKVDTAARAADMVNLAGIVKSGTKFGFWSSSIWKLHAKQKQKGEAKFWLVTIEYVGDPAASIMVPPEYVIYVSDTGLIKAIHVQDRAIMKILEPPDQPRLRGMKIAPTPAKM